MPRTLPVRTRNHWFQRVEALKRNRRKRHREGCFVVEGVRSLDQLAANPAFGIEAYLSSPARPLSSWARRTLAASRAEVHLELSPGLMDELADREDGSELLAVVRIPADDPDRLSVSGSAPLFVLLDQPARPGNLGTVLRSCDALGVNGVVVFGHAADLYAPRTVRAAAGSLFSVPAVRLCEWDALEGWLAGIGSRWPDLGILGTTAHGGSWPDEVDLSGATVLLFGNETVGLSHRLSGLCSTLLSIPMAGSASSLNLAGAVTAVLYEAARQRRVREPGGRGADPSRGFLEGGQ